MTCVTAENLKLHTFTIAVILIIPRRHGRSEYLVQDTYWRVTGRRGSVRFSELQLNTALEELRIPFEVESVKVSIAIGHLQPHIFG